MVSLQLNFGLKICIFVNHSSIYQKYKMDFNTLKKQLKSFKTHILLTLDRSQGHTGELGWPGKIKSNSYFLYEVSDDFKRFIIFLKPRPQINKMFEFKNLDLCSIYDIDNDLPISTDQPLKNLAFTAVNTFDRNSLGNQEEFFYQKSTLNLTDSYQISFENDFMKEHQAVFERYLSNYMESFRTIQKNIGGLNNIQNDSNNLEQKNTMTCVDFIRRHNLGSSFEETQNFVNKFTTYDKLNEFLNIVVRSAPEKISIELVPIAKELLQKYEEVKLQNPSDSQLMEMAKSVAECAIELTNLKVVCFNKDAQAKELVESTEKFLEVFCATVMLVIAQYFQNPYSSQEMGSFKRQLSPYSSDDESQELEQSCKPSKKRKFSF